MINYFVATSHTYEAYHAGMLSCCNRYVHEGSAGSQCSVAPALLADNSTITYGIGWGPRLAKQPGTATTGIALRWKCGVVRYRVLDGHRQFRLNLAQHRSNLIVRAVLLVFRPVLLLAAFAAVPVAAATSCTTINTSVFKTNAAESITHLE